MKLIIDTDAKTLQCDQEEKSTTLGLYSKAAFDMISQLWLKVGWNGKYSYTFTWLGIPIIQLPEDLLRIQEIIYRIKPDVIVETGVAHGGSLVYYASLCKALGKGRVIGIDIDIHAPNRKAIEEHPLSPYITLLEGNSVAQEIVDQVKYLVKSTESVLVVLDSNHTCEHVLAELNAYHSLVTQGSYIVATDGIMKHLYDTPRGQPDWDVNNPAEAVIQFAGKHPEFVLEQPAWSFNESDLDTNLTYWPNAWLRRI